MIQEWWCESCGAKGEVDFAKHAGVWEVYLLINDEHRRVGGDECADTHGVKFVRVKKP